MAPLLFTFACWFAAMCFVEGGWPGGAFGQFLGRLFGAAFCTAVTAVIVVLI